MNAQEPGTTHLNGGRGSKASPAGHFTGGDMSKFMCGVWLLLAGVPATAYAADDEWQVGSSPSFSSGGYGTSSRTEVVHTPITARRLFSDGDVTLVFPFTCISGSGGVTVVDGTPVPTNPAVGRAGNGRGPSTPTTALPAVRTTDCGLGDIVLRARYYLVDERGWVPTIALRAHVKTPTASAERGLGTGKPDEGVGVEVSRTIGGGLLAMADGGFTFIGDPDDFDYNNNWWYDVGIGRDLANGLLNLSVFFAEDRAFVPRYANARDILTALTVKGANGWRVQISGSFGLSDGAPDHGFALGASRRF